MVTSVVTFNNSDHILERQKVDPRIKTIRMRESTQ